MVLLVTTTVGQLIGLTIGDRVRRSLDSGVGQHVDRGGGVLAGVAGVTLLSWLLLPLFAQLSDWSEQLTEDSIVTGVLDRVLPPAPDALRALEELVGEDFSPQVFVDRRSTPSIPRSARRYRHRGVVERCGEPIIGGCGGSGL